MPINAAFMASLDLLQTIGSSQVAAIVYKSR